jgi:aldehyde dehydrogenase (NAD+)/betaine-aldehyde dehydrogenase
MSRILQPAPGLVRWQARQFIDSRFTPGVGPAFLVENPATEAVLVELREASLPQVDQAVEAARRAFRSGVWRDPERRCAALLAFADILERRALEFRSALAEDIGTPVSVGYALQFVGPIEMLRYYAGRAAVDRTRSLGPNWRAPASESIIRSEPVGVVAAIGAYNNPLLYLASKAGAALAAGCTAVFLPSPLSPLAALLFGEVIEEADLPPGVLNIVVGGAAVGRALVGHPGVDKVSFTGSVRVGREVIQQAAQGLKGAVLELGGKSAGIILPGADIEKAALPLHARYIRNAGQGCQSPTRLLVARESFDDFVDLSRDAYAKIPVGDPWNPATMAGPLITAAHRDRVEGFVARALSDGGEILAGGGRPDEPKGWFMNGALIGGLSNHAEIARHELFGPVAIVIPYDSVDEAVAIANDSDLGLAASLFGPLDLAKSVAERLRVGLYQWRRQLPRRLGHQRLEEQRPRQGVGRGRAAGVLGGTARPVGPLRARLDQRHPTVDDQRLSGHVARGIGGQVCHCAGDFDRLAEAPHRDRPADGVERVLGHGQRQPRAHLARRDGVHPDAAVGPLRGEVAREVDERGLACRVGHDLRDFGGEGGEAAGRGDEDDRALAGGEHHLGGLAGGQEGAREIDVHDLRPAGERDALGRARPRGPGVVDEHVETAEMLERPRDGGPDLVLLRDVAGHRHRARPEATLDRAGEFGAEGFLARRERDAGALVGERRGHGGGELPVPAEDERDPPVERG